MAPFIFLVKMIIFCMKFGNFGFWALISPKHVFSLNIDYFRTKMNFKVNLIGLIFTRLNFAREFLTFSRKFISRRHEKSYVREN